jgi:hypothetical protein
VSNAAITYLVGACAGVFSVTAYAAWVLIPAWTAYTQTWQRLAAVFLSLYVLLAFAGAGCAAGIGLILLWDRLT